MENLTTETFTSNPITLEHKTLTISLDKLNKELEPYSLRVNSLDDIVLDKELSAINAGDVLKIYLTKTSPDGDWDETTENWFFKQTKELEDKFENVHDIISSAELDRADLVLTLHLNQKSVEVNKKFEIGGTMAADPADAEIENSITYQLAQAPHEVFKIAGIEMPNEQDKINELLPEVRMKATEFFKANRPKQYYAFLHGKKMNIGSGATIENLYLQNILKQKFYDYAVFNLRGSENTNFATEYANNKCVLAIDMLLGMAMQKNEPILHVTDQVLADVVNKTTTK